MNNNAINIFKSYTLENSYRKQKILYKTVHKKFEESLQNDEVFMSLLGAILEINEPIFQDQILNYLKTSIVYLGKDVDSNPNLFPTPLMNAFSSFICQVLFIYASQFEESFYADYQKEVIDTLSYLYKNNELLSFENSTSFKKLLKKTNEIHREAKRLKPELITSNGYY